MDNVIQCERLRNIDWLFHGSTTRQFNPEPGAKIDELKRLAEFLDLSPKALLFAHQKHTNHAMLLNRELFDSERKSTYIYDNTDAVGTDIPGILASVFTADCVPIFLVDTKARRFMLVHAGWKGTLSRIASHALDILIQRGANPSDVIAWLGPSIGQCCYEVSREMAEDFAKAFPTLPDAIRDRYIDLKEINAFQLEYRGVNRKNIHISDICTKCKSEIFYSYRAMGGLKGRILNVAMILPSKKQGNKERDFCHKKHKKTQ